MKLFLIPCPISENQANESIPDEVKIILPTIKKFLVENIRTARRYISSLKLGIIIDDLEFEILDKKSTYPQISSILKKWNSEGILQIGIISEAGCPGIADPGALAVEIGHKENFEIIPLVGPSSILLSLMASGFSGQSFSFHGYLPIDKKDRKNNLEQLLKEMNQSGRTQIFMETPFRNNALLEDILNTLPEFIPLCIACDIKSEEGFIQTKDIKSWKKNTPDLHKRPCLFLIGKIGQNA
ncbi:MAG: hypothetical protein RIR51_1937 [Bacteroidota bacterium]